MFISAFEDETTLQMNPSVGFRDPDLRRWRRMKRTSIDLILGIGIERFFMDPNWALAS